MSSTMKDADMPLLDRIEAALARVRARHGLMRIPAEATDLDIVVRDCGDEITRLRSDLAQRTADLERMTAERNAALDARDITQRTLDGIDGVLAQRTAERDEARREVCEMLERDAGFLAQRQAASRGWDCFKEDKP